MKAGGGRRWRRHRRQHVTRVRLARPASPDEYAQEIVVALLLEGARVCVLARVVSAAKPAQVYPACENCQINLCGVGERSHGGSNKPGAAFPARAKPARLAAVAGELLVYAVFRACLEPRTRPRHGTRPKTTHP
eukprot:361365-Chlamydomonas_euryale.AAC.12